MNLKSFRAAGLDDLIRGAEADLLDQVAELKEKRDAEKTSETRAILLAEIKDMLKRIRDVSRHAFMAADVDVVVSTAFRASTMLWYPEYREMIEQGQAPFTTIIIDEAGLMSRAATAVLSLLASRRVILAGDPKQLAPISRMSRVLPTVPGSLARQQRLEPSPRRPSARRGDAPAQDPVPHAPGSQRGCLPLPVRRPASDGRRGEKSPVRPASASQRLAPSDLVCP